MNDLTRAPALGSTPGSSRISEVVPAECEDQKGSENVDFFPLYRVVSYSFYSVAAYCDNH